MNINDKLHIMVLVLGLISFFMLFWMFRLASQRPANKCGHKTKTKGLVSAFGETASLKMPINKDGSVDYCLDCISKMTIICTWCKKPIFIGDIITLCSPREKFEVPENSVVYDTNGPVLVGCGRVTCADSGADYAGYWVPGEDRLGKVERFPTLIEQSMMDMEKGGDGIIFRNHQ